MKRKKKKTQNKCKIDYYNCRFYEKTNPEEIRCRREKKREWCRIERRRMEDCLNKHKILFSELI